MWTLLLLLLAKPSVPPTQVSAERADAVRVTARVLSAERRGELRVASLPEACRGVRLLLDPAGRPRLLRFQTMVPDNSHSFFGIYDERGALRYAQAGASAIYGLRFDLKGEFNSAGQVLSERGHRFRGQPVRLADNVVRDPKAFVAGGCPR